MEAPRDVLGELQGWFLAHCNGDWEHSHGVSIATLDNPGWSIEINLLPPHGGAPHRRRLDRVLARGHDFPIRLRTAQPHRNTNDLPQLGRSPELTSPEHRAGGISLRSPTARYAKRCRSGHPGWSTFQPARVVHFSTGLDTPTFLRSAAGFVAEQHQRRGCRRGQLQPPANTQMS